MHAEKQLLSSIWHSRRSKPLSSNFNKKKPQIQPKTTQESHRSIKTTERTQQLDPTPLFQSNLLINILKLGKKNEEYLTENWE